jgi:hypothetical protein
MQQLAALAAILAPIVIVTLWAVFGPVRPESRANVKALRAADTALHANTRRELRAGIREETPEYLRLNAAANEAAAKVSRWHGGTKRGR